VSIASISLDSHPPRLGKPGTYSTLLLSDAIVVESGKWKALNWTFVVPSARIRHVCEGPEEGDDAEVSKEARETPLSRTVACR